MIEAVKARVGSEALAAGCHKEKTTVLLDGAPTPYAVVDLDSPTLGLLQSRRCDYLFVAGSSDTGLFAAIELKSRSFRAEGVIGQLQAGTDLADEWLPDDVSVNFRPVLVHRLPTFSKRRRVALDKSPVRFRGSRVRVHTLSSGARLMAVFDARVGEDGVSDSPQ